MSGKKVSLSGEVHISTGSVYTTVDALEALKVIGIAYGLYSRAEDRMDSRVMLEDGERPALVLQEYVSHHGSPQWETVRVITDAPEQIHRYLAFRETVKIVRQMEIELDCQAREEKSPKKKGAQGHER